MAFVSTANAAPIYTVNAGTLSYVNSYLGFGQSDAFLFTGPQPVSIQGSGATAVAYTGLQSLNVAFNLTFGLIIDTPVTSPGQPPRMASITGTPSIPRRLPRN